MRELIAFRSMLLVDEYWADQVWEAWDKGKVSTSVVAIAWLLIAAVYTPS